jgi:MinD-like ATPase involved in chromosome partitioning or flagellar assembly
MPDDPYQRVDDPWVPDEAYPAVTDSSLSTDSAEPAADSEPFWRSESWLLEPLSDDTPSPAISTDFDWGSGAADTGETSAPSYDSTPAWESPAWDTTSMWENTTPEQTASSYDTATYDTGSYDTPSVTDGAAFEYDSTTYDNAYDGSAAQSAPSPYDPPLADDFTPATEPDATGVYEPPSSYDSRAAFEPTAAYEAPAEIDWDNLGKEDEEPVSWNDLYTDEAANSWASFTPEAAPPAPAVDGQHRDPDAGLQLLREHPHEKGLDPRPVSTNASDFAAQKDATGGDEPPTEGFPSVVYRLTRGHVQMKATKEEQLRRRFEDDIRRSVAGLRQITFTNPKGGSGKTTAALLTSMTLGQLRGGYILAWDNNETQGTLGVRARPDHHANTVRDLIADLPSFSGPVPGRVGDLAKYVRSQGDAMFDVLASDEQATAGEMMTAAAFQAVREVVARFYKLICVDTGNNVRAANWAAAIDSTDQLVVTSSVRWESAYSASRMLDYLEQSGRGDLVANAITVLTMPRSVKGLNLPQVETHFSVRTREVLHAPFDPQLDNGDQIRMHKLSAETRQAWLEIAAAIARGL